MRRILKRAFFILCLLGLVVALSVEWLFLQDQPLLEVSPAPSPEDVATTRQLIRDIHSASTQGSTDTEIYTDASQLNSAIRLGTRLVKGARGRVSVEGTEVLGALSIPVPWWSGKKWLNVTGRVPAFDGHFSFSQVTAGGRDLPPALALNLARIGTNLGLGNRMGDTVLAATTAMTITGQGMTFRLALDEMGKNGVMQGAFGALRGAQMPSPSDIEIYHRLIRIAMADGTLSQKGSFLPYLQFTLQAALRSDSPDPMPQRYTAAILGLAKVCGAKDFSSIVGRLVFEQQATPQERAASCDDITFNDRIDSRRHFLTSAALHAASNTGFAVSVGEFKELYDSISGAGGFDFTDIAANLSGVRMSEALMATPQEDWPGLLGRIKAETDVIVSFDGIPHLMPEKTFETRFGDLDSPAYRAMYEEIGAQIDQLDLYQGGTGR